MKNFNHYLDQVNEKSFKDFPIQLYHSKNNMRTAEGFNSTDAALRYAKTNDITTFEIFKNGSGFHSTTQDEYLVLWADATDSSYWFNRSVKKPELLKKRYVIEQTVNNESTTFDVPTLIQLYYVEDTNGKSVGLYKDLETAEKLEMQSKGKKHIINIDRDKYNSGEINASNAKYYINKNESNGPSLLTIARKATFYIDAFADGEILFKGYTFGANWNGWATTYFEKAEADRVMEESNKINDETYQMVFENDQYVIGGDETYEKEIIMTTDGEKTVWPIGAYAWTWQEETVQNESGEIVPVQAGEVIKLQKPAADTFDNVEMNNDGIEIADCTVCGATKVVCKDHICKTVVEPMAQVDSEYNLVENRFESIRNKYGIKESNMITKLDWFKSINESPSNDDMKSSDSKGELSLTPEQLVTEVQRLFDRYTNDEMRADIEAMFPDYAAEESEDAAYHMLDTIFDSENMSDNVWKALKPMLLTKFKEYFQTEM